MIGIEIRRTPDGRELVCDWGRFDNAPADPHAKCGMHFLVLATPAYITHLLVDGPQEDKYWGLHTAYMDGGRLFVRLDHEKGSWTWELFEGHWWDGDAQPIYVGRWPD